MKRIISILFILQMFLLQNVNSQITKHGELKSKKFQSLKNQDEIHILLMPSFNVQQMIDEDKLNENQINKPLRFAKVFELNVDIKKIGLEENIIASGTIYRLKIKSIGAYSLNFIFSQFELPPGAELYIYNTEKNQVVGALTEFNNNDAKVVPVQPVKGDEATIEYYEPFNTTFKGTVVLSKIGHDYTGILNKFNQYDGRFGTSQSCNVDINCEGDIDWQNASHSVCRLLINASGYCTGSLLNNVNNDGRAYLLIANHCIGSTSDANNTVFVFNYVSPTCGGGDGTVSQSISNSTLRAN